MPFNHNYDGSDFGVLTANPGTNMSTNFNFPLLASINAWRPFTITNTSSPTYPPEWNNSYYSNTRTALSIPSINSNSRIYYTSKNASSNYNSSAVIKVTQGSNTFYDVVSGLSIEDDFGTSDMGKSVLISMLQAFIDGGMYSGQDQISQVPLTSISNPTNASAFPNPSSISTEWSSSWVGWDGNPYTSDYPNPYTTDPENGKLLYSLKYSNDSGQTWKYCSDNTPTSLGARDASHTSSSTSYSWPVSGFPKGTYLLRVECYRQDLILHYAYDQIQIQITN
jgi:hypothetical protein